MAIALTDAAARRNRIYRGFERRNRLVGYLRILVPGAGVILFVLLAGQVVIANLAENFSIGRVSLQADRMVVETPSYSGVTSDGSLYKVTALSAEVGLGAIDAITLNGATLVIDDAGGVQTTATAARAELQTTDETVKVEGQTSFNNTAGTSGTLVGMDLAFTGPVVTAGGAVSFKFEAGEQLDAANMHYDGTTGTWTFSKVTLTLPDTPRASEP